MLHASENGKPHGKVMNAARQRLRRFDQTAGMRTRSAASDCIVRTVLFGSDPLKTSPSRRRARPPRHHRSKSPPQRQKGFGRSPLYTYTSYLHLRSLSGGEGRGCDSPDDGLEGLSGAGLGASLSFDAQARAGLRHAQLP